MRCNSQCHDQMSSSIGGVCVIHWEIGLTWCNVGLAIAESVPPPLVVLVGARAWTVYLWAWSGTWFRRVHRRMELQLMAEDFDCRRARVGDTCKWESRTVSISGEAFMPAYTRFLSCSISK